MHITEEEKILARGSYHNVGKNPLYLGSIYTLKEREDYGLLGSIPTKVEKLEEAEKKAYNFIKSRSNELDKYIALTNLKNTNIRLFFDLISKNFKVE